MSETKVDNDWRRRKCPECLGDGFSKQEDAEPTDLCPKCGGAGTLSVGVHGYEDGQPQGEAAQAAQIVRAAQA